MRSLPYRQVKRKHEKNEFMAIPGDNHGNIWWRSRVEAVVGVGGGTANMKSRIN